MKDLRDTTEFQYGKDLVDKIFEIEATRSADLKSILNRVRNCIDLFKTQREVYVTCFCTETDSPNQCDNYADQRQGYSIAFISALLNFSRHKQKHLLDFRWCQVEYDEEKQLTELRSVIDCWCSYLRRENTSSATRISQGMADHLIRFLCRFKHSKFKKENEWRLVYTPESGDSLEVKHRYARDRLVRYIELDLALELSSHGAEVGRLPIREVMHGPDLQPAHSLKLINLLLNRNGYLTVHVSSPAATLDRRRGSVREADDRK
jgi:Protein of unknown function (DUF2971)